MKRKLLTLLIFANIYSFSTTKKDITELTLPNGLKIFLHEDRSSSDVFGMIICKAGGKNDPTDATGTAHYLEHMAFKGTQKIGTTNWEKEKIHMDKIFKLYEKLGECEDEDDEIKIQKEINAESKKASEFIATNELSNLISGIGGTGMNAGTGFDATRYFNFFPSFQIEKWIDLYSERFINPVFRGFQAELEVVYEEKNMYANSTSSNINDIFMKNCFKNNNYGRPLIGTIDHLKKPSLNKMKKFYETYYVANNMSLILTGNFDSKKIIPLIKEKFGRWPQGKVPKYIPQEEEAFDGREAITVKITPYKEGIMAFRTIKESHEDKDILDVLSLILTNSNETGLFNDLFLDEKVSSIYTSSTTMQDAGIFKIVYTPKIDLSRSTWKSIYQESYKKTEKKIFEKIKLLKNGDYDIQLLKTAKNSLILRNSYGLESHRGVAEAISNVFLNGNDLSEIFNYNSKISKITKEDITRIANKYFNDDYFVMQMKKGRYDSEKVTKPAISPVIAKSGNKSLYAKTLEEAPTSKAIAKFIDFSKDFKETDLKENVHLYYANNEGRNNIFFLTIKYKSGEHNIPNLKYAAQLMNFSGTLKRDIKTLKNDFSKLNCNYSISSDENNLYINIYGFEENLANSLKIFTELLLIPKLKQQKLEKLIGSELGKRNNEKRETNILADALHEYIKFGDESRYLDRMKLADLRDLDAGLLVADFQKATLAEVELHYSGSLDFDKVKNIITDNLIFKSNLVKQKELYVRNLKEIKEQKIYFVNDRNAVQSNIYLIVDGNKYDINLDSKINAFNRYFSGGFSGIVTQEIREYRSLAYGANASYIKPPVQNKKSYLIGAVTTQSDKTIEAVKVFVDIIKNMPQKSDRISLIKNYLTNVSKTNKPGFRALTNVVASWRQRGYKGDPNINLVKEYEQLKFDDIINFYNENIKGKPIAITIVGNSSDFDLDELEKFGEIERISKKDLFNN